MGYQRHVICWEVAPTPSLENDSSADLTENYTLAEMDFVLRRAFLRSSNEEVSPADDEEQHSRNCVLEIHWKRKGHDILWTHFSIHDEITFGHLITKSMIWLKWIIHWDSFYVLAEIVLRRISELGREVGILWPYITLRRSWQT